MSNSVFKSFTYNYLQELPEDIKILIYKRVYQNNYSIVLNELLANNDNLKHYNNLKEFIATQEEPKLNLLNHLSQNIKTQKMQHANTRAKINNSILSLYKKHLTSNNIATANINKLKIASNISTYLDKKIASTFINFLKKSKHIDEAGEYFVLEYEKHYCCFAELYLVLITFWKLIRETLYEFYELHRVAYNIYSNELLTDNCYMTEYTLDKNLLQIKKENPQLYTKITKQRLRVNKTECCYINFERHNIIDRFIIQNNAMIIQLKEL